ncbi:DUF805 domain-containing protein [Novosphingobium colocasiae]|uniref:DUF805 domain-containing protein n=1 Tax=Novosphingobium colocasiae TaxID=1256513 RepID=A0A918UEC1_9SPHN|nr:DUF805 domain-containing protein [Novosphingobium colocasiae]GGY96165.1 hypothetical protein GCM10011614_08650 [Novosphingobium colocasiae]
MDSLRLSAQALRRTFDFTGRAGRAEFLSYLILSQVPLLLLAVPVRLLVPAATAQPVLAGLSWLMLIPAPALVTRRLRDCGLPPALGLLLLALALRALGLDLLALAGDTPRSMVERVLSYVDWLLALPAFILAALLAILPASKQPEAADAAEEAPAG